MPIVKYNCEDCGKEFDADQGSRRKYCPDCTYKRVVGPKKTKPDDETTSNAKTS